MGWDPVRSLFVCPDIGILYILYKEGELKNRQTYIFLHRITYTYRHLSCKKKWTLEPGNFWGMACQGSQTSHASSPHHPSHFFLAPPLQTQIGKGTCQEWKQSFLEKVERCSLKWTPSVKTISCSISYQIGKMQHLLNSPLLQIWSFQGEGKIFVVACCLSSGWLHNAAGSLARWLQKTTFASGKD